MAAAAAAEDAPVRSSLSAAGGRFSASWNASALGDAVTFALHTTAPGWVAIGFNDKPAMAGADMYVGFVGKTSGNVTVLDTLAAGRTVPTLDTARGGSSDVYDVAGARVRLGVRAVRRSGHCSTPR